MCYCLLYTCTIMSWWKRLTENKTKKQNSKRGAAKYWKYTQWMKTVFTLWRQQWFAYSKFLCLFINQILFSWTISRWLHNQKLIWQWYVRLRGATVARLTPDQKVACSNHVGVKADIFLITCKIYVSSLCLGRGTIVCVMSWKYVEFKTRRSTLP